MSEVIKKSYELSLWADILETSPNEEGDSFYKEEKIVTIGSDKMSTPNRAFDIVLKENINGEKTLTFSIKHRYFDNERGEIVQNPFTKYLNNERKIKLYYKNTWYDFVLKECEETSEEYVFSYTAKDLFALELAKVGYNVTFNTDLNNNQGSVTELAEKTLEQTDWIVDKDNSDLLRQRIKEPLYKCTITQLGVDFDVLNVDTNTIVNDFEVNETIYIFYSYIANKTTKFIQFIREKDRKKFELDSENIITSINYRIINEKVNFEPEDAEKPTQINIGETQITIDETYNKNQAYRLVYSQQTLYDPVMKKTVKLYQIDTESGHQDIYSYTDARYITSNVVTSFVTGGTDFGILESGEIQGWSHLVPTEGTKGVSDPPNLITQPTIDKAVDLNRVKNFADIQSFLELHFLNEYDSETGKNAYFNSGIEDNASIVDHIAAGEQFVLRIRCGHGKKIDGKLNQIIPFENTSPGVRAVVAKYELGTYTYKNDDGEEESETTYNILPNSIILDFNGDFEISNCFIEGGTFDADFKNYIIDNVVQVPSNKYCYKVEGDNKEYVWSGTEDKYVEKNTDFIDYYATTATAKMSFSTEALTDPLTKIGIFLYTKDENFYGNNYTYIEDVQITRYYKDANEKIVTIGNVPEATTLEEEYYYLKPTDNTKGEATNIYSSLKDLALENGLVADDIKAIYNENCEKILSIQEEHSNCFNILQSLCETFECWVKISVKHNKDGSLYLNSKNEPIKKVAFKEFIGKENFAGFKYGINLESISRTVDSNEIVTKLIVENVSSEYTDSGSVSIAEASSNRNKDSYILNFSHYLNTNLIQNREACENDVSIFYEAVEALNKKIFDAGKEKDKLALAIDISKGNLDVLENLLSEAKLSYSEAKAQFEEIVFKDSDTSQTISYDEFVRMYNYGTPEEKEKANKILDNEGVLDIIAEIYIGAATASNYEGLVHNLQEEYKKLQFSLYGAKEYNIAVTTAPINEGAEYTTTFVIDDYIADLDFNLYIPGENNFSQHYVSSLNERIFTVTTNNPITHCVFNKLPNHYNLQYYKNGKLHTASELAYKDFVIYSSDQEGVLTRQYKLVPTEEWSNEHPNLDKIINTAAEEKAALEKAFYKKYSRFLQEGTWSSQDYIDSELYYLDALQVSRTSAQPQVTYDIKVNEISELEGYGNYFFEVGDKTFIEDENFFGSVAQQIDDKVFTTPVHEEIVVSEVEWHLDEPESNIITVQNYKTQFEDLFQRISATVQTVEYNEVKYPKTSSILNTNGLIDSNLLLNSLNHTSTVGLNLISNGNITIDNSSILVQDLTKASNLVKIESGGIKTSSDNGQNWFNAIDGYGVNADALTTGTINTQNVWLMDGANPSFRWDKSGISAYSLNEDPEEQLYDYGTYVRLDKYGLYGVKDGENYIASSLDNIKEKASFGLTWDGFFIKNSYSNGYVSISSDDDFQVVTVDMTRNITLEAFETEVFSFGPLEDVTSGYGIPLENIRIIKIVDETDAELNYTIESNVIYAEFEPEMIYTAYYMPLLNHVDLEAEGIIEMTSVFVNGEELTQDEYIFNKLESGLYFTEERKPGDVVTINYKLERIKIGATDFVEGAPAKYGIEIRNQLGETVFSTDDEGNLSVSGTINATDGVFRGTVYAEDGEFTGHIRATSGEFPGSVTVGDTSNYIKIDGESEFPYMASGNYLTDSSTGWFIDGAGEAVFNNISVRGSIKTSVFEKGEIQTVGGAFLFRPSGTIEKAEQVEINGKVIYILTMKDGNNVFEVGDLCKIGDAESLSGGLTAVYEVISVNGNTVELYIKDSETI